MGPTTVQNHYPSGGSKHVLQRPYRKDENGYMQSRKNRCYIGDTMVASTQPRDKLGDWRSQNDEVPTIVWKEYKAKEGKGEKESKKSSNIGRREDHEIGSG